MSRLKTDPQGHDVVLDTQRAIAGRLRARQAEIEEAIFSRVDSVSDSTGSDDDAYVAGLRTAVSAAVEYGLADPAWSPQPPLAVLAQVRRAAELGVGLETVLRRFVAGHGSFVEFIMEEAYRDGHQVDHRVPRHMRKAQELLLARLTDAAASEHRRALSLVADSPERRRANLVRGLLDGQHADWRGLGYELDGVWHLGLIATGGGVRAALSKLQMHVGCELLLVPGQQGGSWAWLASAHRDRLSEIGQLSGRLPLGGAVAIGEPRQGLGGWRVTHEEAKAALPVALCRGEGVTRCADVLLEAALLKDGHLQNLAREVYLSPLHNLLRDSAGVIHETLRVYFASGNNVKVTAARLEVDRRTVWYRLDKVEKRLGFPCEMRRAELEVALRLAALDAAQSHPKEHNHRQ
ncbi:MAG TPA: helix-turn-helix domain-containing protein [Solirubrobacteraceae bacterium]